MEQDLKIIQLTIVYSHRAKCDDTMHYAHLNHTNQNIYHLTNVSFIVVGPLKAYSFSDLQTYRMSSLTMVTVTCSGSCLMGAWNTGLHLVFETSHKHRTKAQEGGKRSLDPIKTKSVEWKDKLETAEYFQIVFGMCEARKLKRLLEANIFIFYSAGMKVNLEKRQKQLVCQFGVCGGLNENVSQRDLNIWSLAGGNVWGGSEGVSFLEEVRHWGGL